MGSGFENGQREVLRGAIGKFTLADEKLGISGWGQFERECLNLCLDYKVLTETELRALTTDRIKALGRASYEMHKTQRVPPDHVMSPHALVYTMRHTDVFTAAELNSIEFDHGENLATFFSHVGTEFPDEVIKLLRG